MGNNLFRPHYTVNILFMGFILGEFLSFTNCQYRVDVENDGTDKSRHTQKRDATHKKMRDTPV